MIEQLKTSNLKDMFQRFVKDFVRVLEDNPRLDGVMTDYVTMTGGTPSVINHGLNREPVGWELVDIGWGGAVDVTIRRNAWDTRTITLLSPVTTCVAKFWVY
jgi:hypothetical protein